MKLPGGSRARWIAAALLFGAAIAIGAIPGLTRSTSAARGSTVDLRSALLHGVALEDGGVVAATGADPYLVPPPPGRPIRYIRLDVTPLGPPPGQFQLYFIRESAPGPFNDAATQPARRLNVDGGVRLEWNLANPVIGYRIDIPDGVRFRVISLEIFDRSPQRGLPRGASAALWGAAGLTLVLLAATLIGGAFAPSLARIKRMWIVGLIGPLTVLVFMLPPFQGPDENAHWHLALTYYRASFDNEPAAHRLPQLLGGDVIPFHPEIKFNPANISAGPVPRMSDEEFAHRTRALKAAYPYVRFYAYPFVLAVSLLFPHIETMEEGLLLLYLCRLLPAVLLIAILIAADRAFDLPFTAVFFFSLPLVMQQMVTVTADVFLNLGALIAVLLFLRARERSTRALTIALSLLTVSIVAVKFILAGLLLLPLALVWPCRRRWLTISAAAVIALGLAYPAALIVWRQVHAYADVVSRGPQASEQLAFLATLGGLRHLAGVYAHYALTLADVASWSGPLGWLDTPLSASHVTLIAASAIVAVALDVWRYAPAVRAAFTVHAWSLLWWCGALVAAFVFVTFVDVLLYYLMTTPPRAPFVLGVQVRHFFPIAIMAVILPVMLRPFAPVRDGSALLRTAAGAALLVLLASRTALLAVDLMLRYW